MHSPPPLPLHVAQEITRVAAEIPALTTSVGSNQALQETISDIMDLDENFTEKGGIFFRTGETSADTAQRFTEVTKQYRDGVRSSLPGLAVEHAQQMSVPSNSVGYKAMISIATRAEVTGAVSPAYHNVNHFADVTAVTANFIEANDAMLKDGVPGAIELATNDKGLLMAVAIGHDLEHDGNVNPAEKHYFNEQKSFDHIRPLLEDSGFSPDDIKRAEIIIKTTSPNGPHAILKQVAAAQRNGQPVAWEKIDPEGKFPDLKTLADDPKLTQMATMLSDADLYASGGAGMESNKVMSEAYTKERQTADPASKIDFRGDGSRMGFFNYTVGKEGFSSNVGRFIANKAHFAMRAETEKNLKIQTAAAEKEKSFHRSAFLEAEAGIPVDVKAYADTKDVCCHSFNEASGANALANAKPQIEGGPKNRTISTQQY